MTDNHNAALAVPHNIVLEDRAHLTLSGVKDVDTFDEETVCVVTERGELTIKGSDLHISRLSLEMGEMAVDGTVSALLYSDKEKPKEGTFFSRMFR